MWVGCEIVFWVLRVCTRYVCFFLFQFLTLCIVIHTRPNKNTNNQDAVVFVYTRHALATLGKFDENIYPAYYEDYDMDLRYVCIYNNNK